MEMTNREALESYLYLENRESICIGHSERYVVLSQALDRLEELEEENKLLKKQIKELKQENQHYLEEYEKLGKELNEKNFVLSLLIQLRDVLFVSCDDESNTLYIGGKSTFDLLPKKVVCFNKELYEKVKMVLGIGKIK